MSASEASQRFLNFAMEKLANTNPDMVISNELRRYYQKNHAIIPH
jgi:hypothetical protein